MKPTASWKAVTLIAGKNGLKNHWKCGGCKKYCSIMLALNEEPPKDCEVHNDPG